MPSMVELVIPISSDLPELYAIEAANLSNEIIRLLDRIENLWDGPGGPLGLVNAIQNIIGLSRSRAEMWLNTIEVSKSKTGEERLPHQYPGCVVASVGDSMISHTADKILAKIKATISKVLTSQGKGGINVKDIPFARAMLSITMQRVKNKYDCEEGIAHSNSAE